MRQIKNGIRTMEAMYGINVLFRESLTRNYDRFMILTMPPNIARIVLFMKNYPTEKEFTKYLLVWVMKLND